MHQHRPSKPLSTDNAYQRVLHHRYHGDRRRIVAALLTAGQSQQAEEHALESNPTLKLAAKIQRCGATAVVAADRETSALRVEQARCRSRVCPLCAGKRAAELETAVLAALPRLDSPGFLTLTLKSSDDPLPLQIDRLSKAARRFRQRAAWKQHIRGGVQVLEITYNAKTDQWHPHLHLLCDLTYWPQRAISREWLAVTGDSSLVHVRRLSSARATAKYVAKYTSKGADVRSIPARRIAEWCHAIHGRRMAQTFGSLHGTPMRSKPEPSTGTWQCVAYMAALVESAKAGSTSAAEILRDLHALPLIHDPTTASAEDLERHAALSKQISTWRYDDPDRDHAPPEPEPPPKISTEQLKLL